MLENRINLSAGGGEPIIQPNFTGSESAALSGGDCASSVLAPDVAAAVEVILLP